MVNRALFFAVGVCFSLSLSVKRTILRLLHIVDVFMINSSSGRARMIVVVVCIDEHNTTSILVPMTDVFTIALYL